MNRLSYVAFRLAQLVYRASAANDDFPAAPFVAHVVKLIRSELLPLIEEVARLHSFRQTILWFESAYLLREDGRGQSLLRDFVVAAVAHLHKLNDFLQVHQEQIRRAAGDSSAQSEDCDLTVIGHDPVTSHFRCHFMNWADMRIRLECVKGELAQQWISRMDFFHPLADKLGLVPEPHAQDGRFIVAHQPRLQYVGNSMARCMLVRLESVSDAIFAVERMLNYLVTHRHIDVNPTWHRTRSTLDDAFGRIERHAISSREARRAEAAMILLQTAVSFSTTSLPTEWLDLPTELINSRRDVLQCYFRGRLGRELVMQLSVAADEIGSFLASQPPRQAEIEAAIADGGLVILEAEETIYWSGSAIATKLSNLQFEMLLSLARSRGRVVGAESLGITSDQRSAAYSARNRLGLKLPMDLDVRIVAATGEKEVAYRLTLSHDRVHIF